MSTRGSGTIVRAAYRGETVIAFAQEVVVSNDGFDWTLGMTEPALVDPIDYDAEIAERRTTHEPIHDVGGDLGNSRFGV